ncbi:MAG: hypothetical protein HXX80_04455 [Nitrososphaerales archaeon]|nr:hypothetical protein [Nitrososphaerales archaeon]
MSLELIGQPSEKERIRTVYKIICIVTAAIIVAITVYGIVATVVQGVEVVGETLVNIEFPPMEFLFYAKPTTWLVASMIAFWFCFLELNKERILNLPRSIRQVCTLLAFFVLSMALYEVLFNFTIWGGLIASTSILGELNPDVLVNPFPNPEVPWNLVFATKIFFVITIISFYTFYFLRRIE